jgi:hypothetical protein
VFFFTKLSIFKKKNPFYLINCKRVLMFLMISELFNDIKLQILEPLDYFIKILNDLRQTYINF